MSYFEFLMVLASIVVAAAMTEVVGGLGRLIRTRGRVVFDWLHFGWCYVVLLISMLYWHGMWPYQDVEFVYLWQVWFLVFPTLFLVIVAFALSPDIQAETDLVVREYFLEKRRPIFAGMAAFVTMAMIADIAITGKLYSAGLLPTIAMVTVFTILAITPKIWVHGLLMVAVALYVSTIGLSEISESIVR